jgi:hypothetical protein
MITNTKVEIKSPKINQVVFFKPWQGKDAKKKAYPVIINDGQYMGQHGLSNFWDWQRLSPTGKINKKVENGYGNFTLANGFVIKVVTETLVADKTATLVARHITVL